MPLCKPTAFKISLSVPLAISLWLPRCLSTLYPMDRRSLSKDWLLSGGNFGIGQFHFRDRQDGYRFVQFFEMQSHGFFDILIKFVKGSPSVNIS